MLHKIARFPQNASRNKKILVATISRRANAQKSTDFGEVGLRNQ
jgi:hypothetical protein